MNKIKRFKITGVKCDGCNYTIPKDQEPKTLKELGEFVNKSCPHCGYNLLKIEDYLIMYEMFKESEEAVNVNNDEFKYKFSSDEKIIKKI